MNRFLAILVMMVSLQIVAAIEGEHEVFLTIDEDEDEVSFDEIEIESGGLRMLGPAKRCRNGKICEKKSDCKRGGCTVRKPKKRPRWSCRNKKPCIQGRFCRDGSQCKLRNN